MRGPWLALLAGALAGCVSTPVEERPAADPGGDAELTGWHTAANVATAPFRLVGAAVYYPVRFVAWDAWAGLYDWVAGEPPEVAAYRAATTPAARARAARAAAAAGHRALAPELLALLAEPDPELRAAGVEALAMFQARELAPDLLKMLDAAADPGVAVAAAAALGGMGATEVWPELAARVRGADGEVTAAAAAHGLGLLRAPQARWALVAALADPREAVRQQAAWALGEVGDARAAPFVLPLLQDAAVEVRAAAAVTLGALRDATAAGRLRAMLDAGGAPKTEAAAYERLALLNALGRLGLAADAERCAAVARARPTPEPWDGALRAAAAQAVARCDPAGAPALLAPLLDDPDARVSRTAALALGALGAAEPLLAALDAPGARAREAAAVGLGRLDRAVATAALIERAAEDRDAVVRHAAARALLAKGDRRGLDVLLAELTRGSRGLEARVAALRVLAALAGRDFGFDAEAWRAWRAAEGERVDLGPFRHPEP